MRGVGDRGRGRWGAWEIGRGRWDEIIECKRFFARAPVPPRPLPPTRSNKLIQHNTLLLRRSDTFLHQRHNCIDIFPAEDFGYFFL